MTKEIEKIVKILPKIFISLEEHHGVDNFKFDTMEDVVTIKTGLTSLDWNFLETMKTITDSSNIAWSVDAVRDELNLNLWI